MTKYIRYTSFVALLLACILMLASCFSEELSRDPYEAELLTALLKDEVSDNKMIFAAQTLNLAGNGAPKAVTSKAKIGDHDWYCAFPSFSDTKLTEKVKNHVVSIVSSLKISSPKLLKLDYTAEMVGNYCNITFYADNISSDGTGKIISEKIIIVCVDTVKNDLAEYSSFFKYDEYRDSFYSYIKQAIEVSSSIQKSQYDSEKLAGFFENKGDIDVFTMEEDGVRFYFDEEDFTVGAAYISVHVPTERFAEFGKPEEKPPIQGGAYFPGYQPVISADEKVIALTFDDGPNYTLTKKLLDILEEKQAKATFFVLGECLDTNGDGKIEPWAKSYLERAVSLGCEIGNHSYNHPNFNTLSKDKIKEQITKTGNLVYQGIGSSPIVLRAPYGNLKEKALAASLGYNIVYWSVDTLDWDYSNQSRKGQISREEAISKTVDVIKKNAVSGRIILMHDIHAISIDAAAEAIDYLHSEGYRLVTVSELCDLLNRTPDETVIYTRSTLYSN